MAWPIQVTVTSSYQVLVLAYPGKVDFPRRDVEVHEVVDDLALEEPVDIVDNNLLADVDHLDPAQRLILNGIIKWDMVLDPALKVLNCIGVFPANILSFTDNR